MMEGEGGRTGKKAQAQDRVGVSLESFLYGELLPVSEVDACGRD